MIALGIDAASSAGWGVVDTDGGRPRVLSFGVADGNDHHAVAEVIQNARQLGVRSAAVETPYLDKNVATVIKLGLIVGRFVQELERAGIPWKGYKAQTWQHQLLHGLIGATSPREQRKAAAATWVKSQFKISCGGDEADAICLATWFAKVGGLQERVIGAGA